LSEDARNELVEDAEAWGIPVEALPDEDLAEGVWPENVAAVEVFLAVAGQWRTVWNGEATRYIGLDYAAVRAGLALSRTKMTPDLWEQVRLVEAGARAALNGIEVDAE